MAQCQDFHYGCFRSIDTHAMERMRAGGGGEEEAGAMSASRQFFLQCYNSNQVTGERGDTIIPCLGY